MADPIWGIDLATSESDQFKEYDLYRSFNEIWFSCPVGKRTVNRLIQLMNEVVHSEKMSVYREQNEIEIIVHFDTGGGSVSSAFKYIDFVTLLQQKGVRVRSIVHGYVCSAGTLMALAANTRQMTANSHAMIHQLSASLWGTYSKLSSYGKHIERVHQQIVNFYLKKTKLPLEHIIKYMEMEMYFTPQEYLEAGFVDVVIANESLLVL